MYVHLILHMYYVTTGQNRHTYYVARAAHQSDELFVHITLHLEALCKAAKLSFEVLKQQDNVYMVPHMV